MEHAFLPFMERKWLQESSKVVYCGGVVFGTAHLLYCCVWWTIVQCYFSFAFPVSALPSTRQHPSYGDCLGVEREYYHNGFVLDCVTQCP